MPPIYLDNAASTRVSDDVLALMTEVMRTAWGNPSSQHPQGAAARASPRDRARRACSRRSAIARRRRHRVDERLQRGERARGARRGAHARRRDRDLDVRAPGDRDARRPARRARAARSCASRPAATACSIPTRSPRAARGRRRRRRSSRCRTRSASSSRSRRSPRRSARPRPHAHFHVDAAQALGKIAIDVARSASTRSSIAGPQAARAQGRRRAVAAHRRADRAAVGRRRPAARPARRHAGRAVGAAGLGLAAERAVAALPTARARWLELAASRASRRSTRAASPCASSCPIIGARRTSSRSASPACRRRALRNVLASRGVYISTGSACADARRRRRRTVLAAIGLPETDGMVRLSFGHDTTRRRRRAARDDPRRRRDAELAQRHAYVSSRTPASIRNWPPGDSRNFQRLI